MPSPWPLMPQPAPAIEGKQAPITDMVTAGVNTGIGLVIDRGLAPRMSAAETTSTNIAIAPAVRITSATSIITVIERKKQTVERKSPIECPAPLARWTKWMSLAVRYLLASALPAQPAGHRHQGHDPDPDPGQGRHQASSGRMTCSRNVQTAQSVRCGGIRNTAHHHLNGSAGLEAWPS